MFLFCVPFRGGDINNFANNQNKNTTKRKKKNNVD